MNLTTHGVDGAVGDELKLKFVMLIAWKPKSKAICPIISGKKKNEEKKLIKTKTKTSAPKQLAFIPGDIVGNSHASFHNFCCGKPINN